MAIKSEKDISGQLVEIVTNKFFTSDFISGIAGDIPLSDEDKKTYNNLLDEIGDDLYVKILFYITHQLFLKADSKKLWEEILLHKYYLSKKLDRNIEITVATLDYLTNIKCKIENPKLIGEAFIGRMAELSSSDGLTRLYNRAFLLIKIKEELNRYKRYKTTFSLAILDIDDFKNVNDRYGHQKGDDVLRKLGAVFNSSRRDLDTCARYGGEEFAILLPHTNRNAAGTISERLRKKVEDCFQNDIKITISLGVSNCPESSTDLEDIIKKADKALYASKKGGKNMTTLG
ncbi:MAG: GGDEF domain-containing protein [Chitinispirillaceae bacterium]|nr:GGDEF domain-containing protein [Chitinispirillaceae bacterium]